MTDRPCFIRSLSFFLFGASGPGDHSCCSGSTRGTGRSGTIVEALGAYSYVDLRHAYYDVTLKDKLSHDETTPKMLDLIIESRTVDLGVIYEFALGKSISSVLDSIKKNGAENLASLAEKNANSFQKNYEKIVDAYTGIE